MVPPAQDEVVSSVADSWGRMLISGPEMSEVIRRLSASHTHRMFTIWTFLIDLLMIMSWPGAPVCGGGVEGRKVRAGFKYINISITVLLRYNPHTIHLKYTI